MDCDFKSRASTDFATRAIATSMPRAPRKPNRRKATYAVLSPLRLPISPPRPRPNLSAYTPTRRRLGLDGGFGALLHPPVHQNALAAARAASPPTDTPTAATNPGAIGEGRAQPGPPPGPPPPPLPAPARSARTGS